MSYALRFMTVAAWTMLGTAALLRADVIETKDGTHLVGHITRIADGKVYVETQFAGPIAVNQTQVVRLTTDGPVAVRLTGGSRYDGQLTGAGSREEIATTTGPVDTEVAQIAATWAAGAPDPQTLRPKYHWTYEASVNVTGKSGNHSQLGTAYGVTATLKRLKDTLVLSSAYNRQVTDGVKSADQFKAGADYTDNYSDRNSWYARDIAGFDRVVDLAFYNTAAAGYGYDMVKEIHQTLTARIGFAHRYERYSNPATPNVTSAALDLELRHSLQFADSKLTTSVAVVPAFKDFNNVIITHETDYDIPLAKSAWKLRLGLSDNFVSRPPPGFRKLDTTYFGSLVWDLQAIKLGRFVPRRLRRWWQ